MSNMHEMRIYESSNLVRLLCLDVYFKLYSQIVARGQNQQVCPITSMATAIEQLHNIAPAK
jgi:hypothetical protein